MLNTVNVRKPNVRISASTKIGTKMCPDFRLSENGTKSSSFGRSTKLGHFRYKKKYIIHTYTVNVWIRNNWNLNYAEIGTEGSLGFRQFGFQTFGLLELQSTSEIRTVRILDRSILFGCNFCSVLKVSEIRTILFGFQTLFSVRNPNRNRSNVRISDISTRLDHFIYKK